MDLEWGNESDRSLKLHLEGTDGRGSSSNAHFDSENITSESSSSACPSQYSNIPIPAPNLLGPDTSCRALSSSSSSSLTMASDGPFQVLPTALIKPRMDDDQSEVSLKDYVSSDSSIKSDELEYESSGPATTSMVSSTTHESAVHTSSPVQPPPSQVMNRSGGNELYRIPSVVFARSKTSSPVEWSIASNESLFSIHIGNNSFSRDHVTVRASDPPKSEELSNSSELVPFESQSPGDAVVVVPDDEINELEKIFKANQRSVEFVHENGDRLTKAKIAIDAIRPINSSRSPKGSKTNAQIPSFLTLTEEDKLNQIKIDTQNRQKLQQHHQNMQKPSPTPTSGSSKRCCGSCGSCRSRCCCYGSSCSWRSCCSWWSCCSWRSCCSWWSCCSWRSCCSWWSCCSWRSCSSCWSCSSCRTCCSCRSCFSCPTCCSCRSCCSCFSCNSCRSCCACSFSCCCCCSSFSCQLCCCC